MLIALVVTYFSIFFFIPLAIGALVLMSTRGSAGSDVPRIVGITLVGAGMLGALNGLPFWYEKFERERASRAHFATLCQTAVVKLPATAVPSEGVVWLDPDAGQLSFLSNKDQGDDFIDPGRGLFQAVQVQVRNSSDFWATRWDPETAEPDRPRFKSVRRQAPTLPFAVRTKAVGTDMDKQHGVDGIETTVTNVKTQEVIARRVVYARYSDSTGKWERAMAVCPPGSLDDADCTSNGCSVVPFVIKAVPPALPTDLSRVFHLHRGSGKTKIRCEYEKIKIGPGIAPKDIEWWADGREGWETLNLRVKATGDHLYCDDFFWAGNHRRPKLRFADGGAEYSASAIYLSGKRGSAAAPRNLGDTL